MTETFRGLYNVIAPWDIEKCLMNPVNQQKSSNANSRTPQHTHCISPSSSWASVAATHVANENGVIKFRSSDGPKRANEQQEHLQYQHQQSHDSRDRRVIWVRPWSETRALSEISNKMKELGAIYSIAFAPEERAVCIIFQHAYYAVLFLHHCAKHIGIHGISPFGKDQEVTPGLSYPLDDGLRRMDPPHNERRRLTFARSQLFSSGITEARFRKDIEEIVGPSNIERLWLFNTGNATVVFSAVPLAKMVRERFLRHAHTRNHPYEGVMVSFSHDPCERDLHLVSQIPGHANYIGGNANAAAHGYSNNTGEGRANRATVSSTDVSSSARRMSNASSDYQIAFKRRNTGSAKPDIDEDGWQTVKKRR